MFLKKNLERYNIFIFVFVIIISYFRSPYIFKHGRFMAEEGSKHFANVWEHGFWAGLFYVEMEAGYFNFIANFLTAISSLIAIEFSPIITVYGSLFFVLLPIYFVLFRESKLFDNNKKKIIGSFLLFITPPFVPEIWVNSINTQIYLCIGSILILFMINLESFQKKINHVFIFVAGFSGVYTCCLLPLFATNFYIKKNFYNFLNFLILFIASCIQFFFVLQSKISNALPSTVLAADLDVNLMLNYIYNILLKPFFGRQIIHFMWENIISLFLPFNYGYTLLSIFFIILIVLLFNYKKLIGFIIKDKVLLYLIFIFLIVSALVLVGAAGHYVGGRYAVIPGATLLLIVLHMMFKTKMQKIKIAFAVLISFSLISGMYEFRPPTKNVKHQYLKYLDCINCPEWKNEIKKWKKDNQYIIGIWPYPRKRMKLKNFVN